MLPGENFVYYGDGMNMPYGDRSREDILLKTRRMLCFLADCDVKVAAVACNTISTLIDYYRDEYPFKIVSVIESVVSCVRSLDADRVGVLGTTVTVRSRVYDRLISQLRPGMKVIAAVCPFLSASIEHGELSDRSIDPQLIQAMEELRRQGDVKYVILGCTHYPLVADHLKRLYPDVTFIDPAFEQAEAVKSYLVSRGAVNKEENGVTRIYTSGDPDFYSLFAHYCGVASSRPVERLCITGARCRSKKALSPA